VITASIVAGSSDPALIATSQNPTSISFADAPNCIRIAGRVPPGTGAGAIISNASPGMRICRVRLTNTVAFGHFQPNLAWTTTTIYPTEINAYVGGLNTAIMQPGSQTTNNLSNSILNPTSPPTPYIVNGGGVYCQGEIGLPVSLSNSELNVLYTLYKNSIALVPDYPGTGSAIDFGNQLFGTYTVTGTNGGGTTPMTGSAAITENPTPPTPIIGTITQPTCAVSTGSVVLSGLPSGNWTINPGNLAGNTTSTTILNLATGTHNFTVTDAAGCTSVLSANVVINAQPATPAAPVVGSITQPTCAVATGSVVLSGLPAGNWIINPGNIGGSSLSTTISGLAPGTYNFTVTDVAGCASPASTNTVINAQPATPAAPIAGAITHPTCALATGSVALSGLPSGNWTINPGNRTGSSVSTTISGLAPGTYNFTVTNAAGCTSVLSVNIVINSQPTTPTAPIVGSITQPTCSIVTGSVALSGLPAGNWTINPGSVSGSSVSTTISGLAPGTYNYTVTNSSGCISAASAVFVINAPPVAPVLVTQSTATICSGTSTNILLNATIPSAYRWSIGIITGSITGASAGSGLSITQTLTNPDNTAAGTVEYIVTPTSLADLCEGEPTVIRVTVNAIPAAPVITLTQNILYSDASIGNQWYFNSNPIIGATDQTYIDPVDGDYNAITTINGCASVISNTIHVIVTDIKDVILGSNFEIYPVPSDGHITLVMNTQTEKRFDIIIHNALGSKIFEVNDVEVDGTLVYKVDISWASSGIYYVTFKDGTIREGYKIILK
jgi:hypothetical protein